MASIFPPCDERLLQAIKECSCAAIIAHRNPDGDALYSSLAMGRILEKMGKEVLLLNEGPFLRDDIKYLEEFFKDEADKVFIDRSPLVIILDCSTPDRPGRPLEALMALPRIVIDHHSAGVPFTEEGMSYIVPASPSTTLLVDCIREELGVSLDRETADALYRGFATDTGFYHFLTAETAPESLRKAAAFTEKGISPYDIYDEMHDGRKLEDIQRTSSIISSAQPYLDGRLLIAVQGKEIENARLSDGVYAALLETAGVSAVILIKEKEDSLEIGFRSKNHSQVDCGAIAATLGGGGHKRAAGATLGKKTVAEAKAMLIALIEKEL